MALFYQGRNNNNSLALVNHLESMLNMKVGIIFGGPSREREISFAGGRTVYDNLDKLLFEPIPLFVDSNRRLIHLDWSYLYKGTIRDFYPPVDYLPKTEQNYQMYIESLSNLSNEEYHDLISKVGKEIHWSELSNIIEFAFLALHGEFGEDGQIQGLLETYGIPYSGSGIMASSIGMDKSIQKRLMKAGGFDGPSMIEIVKNEWLDSDREQLYHRSIYEIGWPMVIRPSNQGSSIGVSILSEEKGSFEAFSTLIDKAFFRKVVEATTWKEMIIEDRVRYIRDISDIRDGLGFPMKVEGQVIHRPDELEALLNKFFLVEDKSRILLEAFFHEQKVILESFIRGREFSCIVLRKEDGSSVSLPPTEIIKGSEVFDYRSKYLPGLARKETPIRLPDPQIRDIQQECKRLFEYLNFKCYARIDGFINETGQIFLNDPNTTSGMMPSSFFFHQAAEIGLNPTQFLTYIIRCSLMERAHDVLSGFKWNHLLHELDKAILKTKKGKATQRKKVAVILGGYSFERHISMESGRNIYEKLSSSEYYEPIPIFLSGSAGNHRLYQIPINLLLKDNADDIRDKINNFSKHTIIEETKDACLEITKKYASDDVVFEPVSLTYEDLANLVELVFIALHGRPGEDGAVQENLERVGLPYNGSGVISSRITINKYDTLQNLKRHGFTVAEQLLIQKEDFLANRGEIFKSINDTLGFPCVAKPVDDGCSSAVKVIKSAENLKDYLTALFRDSEEIDPALRKALKLQWNEEFPQKNEALIEELITANGASHFLEVTGGMLTHYRGGKLMYEVFEPSEALASGEVLSLEEKFLAGEGQNITPARYDASPDKAARISSKVKSDLERAAKILGVEGYCRIDAFVRIFPNEKVETVIIEVNSLPGMTPATCIFHQCAINGYQPHDFIHKILSFASEKTLSISTLNN